MATTKKAAKTEIKNLEDLFLDGLKDLYYAEKKILRALQKMAKGAASEEVTAAFEKHRAETEGQVERLRLGGPEVLLLLPACGEAQQGDGGEQRGGEPGHGRAPSFQ